MTYREPVGVSILTNGARLEYLKSCVSSFLSNCHYRPLIFGIFSNGSTDGTKAWLATLLETYGVTWHVLHSDKDIGCAAGTNQACDLVRNTEYAIHIESDFEHLPSEITGEDKMWLHRALEFMRAKDCCYLYLRRMTGEREMLMHWWAWWMSRMEGEGPYLRCFGFTWSNNPHLRKNAAIYQVGTLPLDVSKDGPKGSPNWCRPELEALPMPRPWVHQWGLFVHERPLQPDIETKRGCGIGRLGCKYGFFKDGTGEFCSLCDKSKDYREMKDHEDRYKKLKGFPK